MLEYILSMRFYDIPCFLKSRSIVDVFMSRVFLKAFPFNDNNLDLLARDIVTEIARR